jgi:predicted PhzF superfamily epimerase YddE/YHI9
MRIQRFQVDAFTRQPFAGNPAAVCPLSRWLDDAMLRKVAAENNLPATAFFVPQSEVPQVGHYDIRWFTPQSEIKLCGHATLASAFVVLELLQPKSEAVRFQTRFSGELTVVSEGELLAMDFPAIVPKPCPKIPDGLLRALGPGAVPSEVLEANETYIAVYDSESAVRSGRPDPAQLRVLHPYAVALTAPGDEVDFVSRYFAPSYGVPEDPVTGSIHCALTPYWAARLNKTSLHARQLSNRGGELWCELSGDRVTLKGAAVLTLEGWLEF